MTRLAALLPLLVACNAGPIQWSDASSWQSSSEFVSCPGLPADVCSVISAYVRRSGAASVGASSVSVSISSSCFAVADRATDVVRAADPHPVCVARETLAATQCSGRCPTAELTFSEGSLVHDRQHIAVTSLWRVRASWLNTSTNQREDATSVVTVRTYIRPSGG